jgi:hypothetical protein
MPEDRPGWDRRRLMRLGLTIAPGLVAVACTDTGTDRGGSGPAPGSGPPTAAGTAGPGTTGPGGTLTPTPACVDDDDETPAQTEGPFFTPGSPERAQLREPGMAGTPLTITGFVVDTACRPAAGALLDFWQADADGAYDNAGFRLRGHQFTGPDGAYRLSTVLPGLYTGRTRHIHVKAQIRGGPVLTTQLYFPGEARNASDGIFDDALVVRDYPAGNRNRTATFTFVLTT